MARVLTVDQPCRLELECPEGVHIPGPASLDLLKYLFTVRGKSVLDLGCGNGLFAIAAAKMGASEVWATDLSPAAVDCTRRNAERNGVDIVAKAGDLFEPVEGRLFDLVVTVPPQMPAPAAARGPAFGGVDGLRYFESILREAPEYLERGGELLTCLLSLAETRRFESMLSERFRFRALPKTRGAFTSEEVDGFHPGLCRFLSDRRYRGLAEFEESEWRQVFSVRSYLAMKL
ncbi:MAG: class I SAM-dependent methyltransferase [Planctomycetota bacterium]|nr:MAG: class I SAM-dependent methyltransferase [Planctomycetota bacterium]